MRQTQSRSPEGLEKMMTVIVTACAAFGLTVSEAKTGIMCLHTKDGEHVPLIATACTNKLSSLCTCAGLSAEIGTSDVSTQRVESRRHGRTPGGKMETYGRPSSPLRLERADAEQRAS